jgi:hypothetical protein
VNRVIFFLLLFVFPFIASTFFHFYLKRELKNIKDCLALEYYDKYEANESNEISIQPNNRLMSDVRKSQYYSIGGIDKSFPQAIKYLAVGIAEQSDLFLDMSLVKYIADHHHTAKCFCLITQLLSYFPHESRLFQYFFSQTCNFPNLKMEQRFLLFQVYQVKNIRESSSSSDLILKFYETKTLVKRGSSLSKKLWTNPNVPLSFFYQIKKDTDQIHGLYLELINKYPNNARLYEDYSYFLIEYSTDFIGGLKKKYQGNLINEGQYFAVDNSFRSLVASFPAYLKSKILNAKGDFIGHEVKSIKPPNSSSHSSDNHSQHFDVSDRNSIDENFNTDAEEHLGITSFSHPRLRLACQKALKGRKSMKSVYVKYGLLVSLLIGVLLLLFEGFYFYSFFDHQVADVNKFFPLQQFAQDFVTYIEMLMLQLLNEDSNFNQNIFARIIADDGYTSLGDTSIFTFSGDFFEKQDQIIEEGVIEINNFLDILVIQSLNGIKVHEKYQSFTSRQCSLAFCSNNTYYKEMQELFSFYHVAIYISSQTKFLINHYDLSAWKMRTELCEVLHAYLPIAQGISRLYGN